MLITRKSGKAKNLKEIFMKPEIGVLVPLLLLIVITTVNDPRFLTANNISVVLCYAAFVGTASLGQTLVIMAGEIDLSVGCTAGFGGIVFAICAVRLGFGPFLSILVALLAGGMIGAINGFLVTKCGLINFVATLATMYISWGLMDTFSGGHPVSPLPQTYDPFQLDRPLNLSWAFFVFLGVFIVMEIVVRYTKAGRLIQSTGGNKEAALMAGINVRKVKFVVYVISGALAALCGSLVAMSAGSASNEYGPGMEFRTITACAVGGISLSGGVGTVFGAGLGILLIQLLNDCMQLLNIESNWQLVITGVVLILAILFDITKKKHTYAISSD